MKQENLLNRPACGGKIMSLNLTNVQKSESECQAGVHLLTSSIYLDTIATITKLPVSLDWFCSFL